MYLFDIYLTVPVYQYKTDRAKCTPTHQLQLINYIKLPTDIIWLRMCALK